MQRVAWGQAADESWEDFEEGVRERLKSLKRLLTDR